MNNTDLIHALKGRGVDLNAPAYPHFLFALRDIPKTKDLSRLIDLYAEFDGFKSPDQKSQINLWPSQAILKRLQSVDRFEKSNEIHFADFLIDSDFYSLPSLEYDGIFMVYERRVVAQSLDEFLEYIILGRFDFLE
jgi:hypothetical protein